MAYTAAQARGPGGHGDAFSIWRGDAGRAEFEDYTTPVTEGMVVLDAVHQIQATQANDLAVPLELQGRQVRLLLGGDQRQAAAHVHDAARPCPDRRADHGRADAGLPVDEGPRDRRVVELRGQEEDQAVQAAPARRPDGTWRMEQADVDRVQEFRKCIECFLCQDVCHVLRDHQKHDEFIGPRFLVHVAALEMHPLDTADRLADLKDGTASATATSRSAARRSAPRTSRSPTTRSSR